MSEADVETYYGQWKSHAQGSSRAFAAGGAKAEQIAEAVPTLPETRSNT